MLRNAEAINKKQSADSLSGDKKSEASRCSQVFKVQIRQHSFGLDALTTLSQTKPDNGEGKGV